MKRIERVERDYNVCARKHELRARTRFDSYAPPQLHASLLGKESHLYREVHECDDDARLFASHRARLLGIAHRMLGPHCDAEDVVQDVYLRWRQSARGQIESPVAFLLTITTRLCLDRLRERKRRRTEYCGPCLLDHVPEEHVPSPELELEFSEDVSMAFLAVLERLGPEERAAFLLHNVLDYDYPEMGRLLSKTESVCRQTIHRTRARLRDSRAQFAVTREFCYRVVRTFFTATGVGDREALIVLLAAEVKCMALWINTHFLFDRQGGSGKEKKRATHSTAVPML
jgi:RNA polymerase sigma factor (sigma-70 family)